MPGAQRENVAARHERAARRECDAQHIATVRAVPAANTVFARVRIARTATAVVNRTGPDTSLVVHSSRFRRL